MWFEKKDAEVGNISDKCFCFNILELKSEIDEIAELIQCCWTELYCEVGKCEQESGVMSLVKDESLDTFRYENDLILCL